MRFDPVRVILRNFLQEIERALRYEPIAIFRQPRELLDQVRILFHKRADASRLGDRAPVAASQQAAQIRTGTQTQPKLFMANPACQIFVMCRILSPSNSMT